MGYFLVGTNIKYGNKNKTWEEIKEKALKSGGTVHGLGYPVNIERDRFKLGSIDLLMHIIDIISKFETQTDGLIKRIEKQYQDLDEKKDFPVLTVETPAGYIEVGRYIVEFKWDDARFARNKPLTEVLKLVQLKVEDIDKTFRTICQNFLDARNAYSTINKKEGGNFLSKDLNEVLAIKSVKQSDFFDSEYLTTLIAIVPKNSVEEWETKYETLTDNIVPRSTKKFPVEDKDGYTLWRVVLFRTQAQEFIHSARDKMKVTVKEFKYDEEYIKNREKDKTTTITTFETVQTKLIRMCKLNFSEAFIAFMHLKLLKLLVDCAMRFGVNEQYLNFAVDVGQGKEKTVIKGLLQLFTDASQLGLYGSKEDLQEAEDFYPFVYIPVNLA